MVYWGWRPLVCGMFISTWVTGCTIVTSSDAPTGTPTDYPSITLMSGRLSDPTAPPLASAFFRPLAVSPAPRPSDDAALEVSAPTCYPADFGQIACFGRIINGGNSAVGEVVVEVVMHLVTGEKRVGTIATVQPMIAPGAEAPYSIIFPAPGTEHATISARLISFRPVQADAVAALVVSHITQRRDDFAAVWIVTAQVNNPSDLPIHLDRAVVMLTDDDDRVLGYRVDTLDDVIAPRGTEHIALSIWVFADDLSTIPRVTLSVEGTPLTPVQHR